MFVCMRMHMHVYVYTEVRDQMLVVFLIIPHLIYLFIKGEAPATACTWLSEDNLVESGLSFHLSMHSGIRLRSPD